MEKWIKTITKKMKLNCHQLEVLSQLALVKNIQFKHIFVAFQRSLFAVCFTTISAGPLFIDLDSFILAFDSTWRSIILVQGTQSTTIITRELVKVNRQLITMILVGTIMLIGFGLVGFTNFDSFIDTSVTFSAIIYTLYLTIEYIYVLRLAVALVSTGYQLIEKRLETCSTIGDTNLGHIRLCRQCHNQLVQVTDLIGSTFKHVFSSYICLFVPQFVIGFYQLTDSSQPLLISIVSIGWNSVNFFYVVSLSQGLSQLNTLPQSYYLTLYLTSFGQINDVVKLEIRHYLGYIANRDTGFRLWGNFLVTGQLLPKLLVLVFSYLTAAASFLQ
ncbi:uncharacterized protein LOC128389118 isoform X2 [Panonychus citri]|uniref:uncharacterized protein LOC128389118 isoform X2 n=1 Tax=Panonychus citri TaxID=50023 RepID=UPI002307DA9E|nr:uncharacterized protein LOC128389118 isoform X2 [Panonychus citri]